MGKGVQRRFQKLFVLSLVIMGVFLLPKQSAYAAAPSPVKVFAVDYSDESMYVLNRDNTKIYYALENDAAKDNWEVLNIDTDEITMIDLSWLSPNIENTIIIRGEENDTQSRIIIKKKTPKLDISIRYDSMGELSSEDTIASLVNIMTTAGTGENPIDFSDLQWRKGEDTEWKPSDLLTVEQLEKYLVKGTYLCFRIAPVSDVVDLKASGSPVDLKEFFDQNAAYQLMQYPGMTYSEFCSDLVTSSTVGTDYPDGRDGRRASNEVKVKVAKKSSPNSIKIDGAKFTADIKYGDEYRVTTTVGTVKTTSPWTQILDKKVRKISLADIINDGSNGMTDAFPAMKLEIRDYATSKAAASKITSIALDAQRVPTGTMIKGDVPEGALASNKNIYVSYNGTKNLSITIPSASASNPYEYCVIKPDSTFSLSRTSWSSITKATEVKVLSSRAVDGGTLYIRQKEIKAKAATSKSDAVDYAMASTYLTYDISYPSIPAIEKTTYTFNKNYSEDIIFDIVLNKAGNQPFETKIKGIKLGTKELKFTSVVTPEMGDPVDASKVYTMRVTLDKAYLNSLANCYSRAVMITYQNGTVDKTSLKLTIQNAASATALVLTPSKGTAAGTTSVKVSTDAAAGNIFVYEIGDSSVANKTKEDTVTAGDAFTSGADITITAGKYLTVYEINSTTKKIVKYRSIQIASEQIK